MNREVWIDRLYDEIRKSVPISREAYGNSLYGWDVEPILLGDELLGLYIRRGHETHMSVSRRNCLKHARHIISVYLEPNLERLGYLLTRSDGNAKDDVFLKRLGYYEIGKENGMTIYRLDELKIK